MKKHKQLLRFDDKTSPNNKHKVIHCSSLIRGGQVGVIKFNDYWKEYAFYPTRNKTTMFNSECLSRISDQINSLNQKGELIQ